MSDQTPVEQNEFGLFDIYDFFREGWKTILLFTSIGIVTGIVFSLVLPEKFQASVLIEPASVATRLNTNAAISRQAVEQPAVLAEKMKQPTYYSVKTLKDCGLIGFTNPGQTLVSSLKPNVARNSVYISISFIAESSEVASACLESVLVDVINNQRRLAEPLISNIQVELASAEQELKATITERDQQRQKNKEKLAVAQSKLIAAQKFVERVSKESLSFNFSDPQFSASALLISTLIKTQNEIKDLELQINALEMEIAANITDRDQAVRKMTNMVNELKNALLPPNTKDASFAAPIYAPTQKVEPKRTRLTAIGLFAGFAIGILILLLGRMKKILRKHSVNVRPTHID